MSTRQTIGSEYMHWAKTRPHARFDLAVSGMPNVPLEALGASIDDLEITNTDAYGYTPLRQSVASRYGVALGNVVAAAGTSMANHSGRSRDRAPVVPHAHPGWTDRPS